LLLLLSHNEAYLLRREFKGSSHLVSLGCGQISLLFEASFQLVNLRLREQDAWLALGALSEKVTLGVGHR